MNADDWRVFTAGFFSPIILLLALALWLTFIDWAKATIRHWKASRYNAIYSRGYSAGKRDCEESD